MRVVLLQQMAVVMAVDSETITNDNAIGTEAPSIFVRVMAILQNMINAIAGEENLSIVDTSTRASSQTNFWDCVSFNMHACTYECRGENRRCHGCCMSCSDTGGSSSCHYLWEHREDSWWSLDNYCNARGGFNAATAECRNRPPDPTTNPPGWPVHNVGAMSSAVPPAPGTGMTQSHISMSATSHESHHDQHGEEFGSMSATSHENHHNEHGEEFGFMYGTTGKSHQGHHNEHGEEFGSYEE